MKYSNTVDINLPRQRVIELFDSSENLSEWMPGLQSFEPISGQPGEEGAKSRLRFKMGKREMEMIETISKRDLPKEFHGTYDTKGVHNIQENYFEEIDANTTRWTSHSEFQFASIGMKLMGWLMPGAFKKQSQKFMDNFKEFAESRE